MTALDGHFVNINKYNGFCKEERYKGQCDTFSPVHSSVLTFFLIDSCLQNSSVLGIIRLAQVELQTLIKISRSSQFHRVTSSSSLKFTFPPQNFPVPVPYFRKFFFTILKLNSFAAAFEILRIEV